MASWDDDDFGDTTSSVVQPPKTWEDEEDLEGWDDEPEEEEKPPEPVAPILERENWRGKERIGGEEIRPKKESKPWEKKTEPIIKIIVQPKPVPPPQPEPKPKKVPKQQFKREVALKELEEKEKEKEKEGAPLTSEEIQRLKKEAEEMAKAADLINAKDLFDGVEEIIGVREIVAVKALSEKEKNDQVLRNFEPITDKDFLTLAKAIGTRMDRYANSSHYRFFVKELAKQLMEPLATDDLSSVVNGLNALINDKLKATKGKKTKKVVAPKLKLNATKGTDNWDFSGEAAVTTVAETADDYDFM